MSDTLLVSSLSGDNHNDAVDADANDDEDEERDQVTARSRKQRRRNPHLYSSGVSEMPWSSRSSPAKAGNKHKEAVAAAAELD